MSDVTTKQPPKVSPQQAILVVFAVIALTVGTGLVVHHSDTNSNTHAMIMSEAMQKKTIQKAANAAAMKQAETDKMAAHNAMANDTPSSTQ